MNSKELRGFAVMDKSKQKAIARKGGLEAHRKGTAHQFSSAEARHAGRKGGLSVSRNRVHMALIGRHGGQAKGARAQLACGTLAGTMTPLAAAGGGAAIQAPPMA